MPGIRGVAIRATPYAVMTALILSSCFMTGDTQVSQKLSPDVVYRRDMRVCVNGRCGDGVLVAPKAPSYAISGKSKGRMDLLTLTNCHREYSAEDQGNEFSYAYTPNGLETEGFCPIKIEANERKRGRHGWAFIDFEGPDATLPGVLVCDGQVNTLRGVGICQSRLGLNQIIEFPVDVETVSDSPCPMGDARGRIEGRKFAFKTPPGECTFPFREVAEPHRVLRLTTIGYDSILIREVD